MAITTRPVARQLRARLPTAVALAGVGILLSDSTRRFNIQGELTLLVLAILGMIVISGAAPRPPHLDDDYGYESRPSGSRLPPIGLTLFVLWATLTMLVKPVTTEGYQNIVVDFIFVLVIPAAAAATSSGTPVRVLRVYQVAGVAAAFVYLGAVAVYGPNNEAIYGPALSPEACSPP